MSSPNFFDNLVQAVQYQLQRGLGPDAALRAVDALHPGFTQATLRNALTVALRSATVADNINTLDPSLPLSFAFPGGQPISATVRLRYLVTLDCVNRGTEYRTAYVTVPWSTLRGDLDEIAAEDIDEAFGNDGCDQGCTVVGVDVVPGVYY